MKKHSDDREIVSEFRGVLECLRLFKYIWFGAERSFPSALSKKKIKLKWLQGKLCGRKKGKEFFFLGAFL